MKRLMFAMLACLFWSLFISACAAPRAAIKTREDFPAVEESRQLFDYEKKPIEARMELAGDYAGYEVYRVAFPSYDASDPDNPEVIAWYYKQKTNHRTAGIMQIPILGGDYQESKIFAHYYARQGFHVLRFERKSKIFDPTQGFGQTRRVVIGAIIDLRRGLDWWLTRPELDPHRIGVSGISMGGFMGELLLSVDDRPAAGVVILSGGDFPQIFAVSTEEDIITARNRMKEHFGWDDQALYAAAWKDVAAVDPQALAPLLDPRKILFISMRYDWVVPYRVGDRWWRAAYQPRRVTLPAGHFSSFYFMRYILHESTRHFCDRFGYAFSDQDTLLPIVDQ